MWKELREIREKIGPFNNNKEKVATNPFKEGHLILIHQQPMEKTHKMSPKRWGAYKYRIHSKYSMRTKRARRPPMYEIVKSSVDRWTMVMSSLSPIRGAWDMPRFSVRSDGREGWWPVALSTSWRKGTNGHSRARPRRARLIYIYIYEECLHEGVRAVPRSPKSWLSNFGCPNHCIGGKGESWPMWENNMDIVLERQG